MIKRALALATLLAGCSLHSHPEHIAPLNPPIIRSEQPVTHTGPYAAFRCHYETKMQTWGYTIECRTSLARILLDHYEWAPESVTYDGHCDERLFFEGRHALGLEEQKEKWIDYGCNGVDAHMRWTVVETPSYTYDRLDEMESPAPDSQDSFDAIKEMILGAGITDAEWRSRFDVPPRGVE